MLDGDRVDPLGLGGGTYQVLYPGLAGASAVNIAFLTGDGACMAKAVAHLTACVSNGGDVVDVAGCCCLLSRILPSCSEYCGGESPDISFDLRTKVGSVSANKRVVKTPG